ncbi:MAG: efflux RND transporter periplasmic adaptor subunit [Bernardetiaceae bacterium]
MKAKKIITSLLIVIAIGGTVAFAGVTLLSNKEKVEAKVYRQPPELRPLVTTFRLENAPVDVQRAYLGTFQPYREIDLLAETNGKVIEVGVERGQNIEKGHVIARLDNDMIKAQMIAAEASYQKALADVKRYQDAVAGNAIPKINLDNAQLGLKVAESQRKVLEKQLELTTITSPFGGLATSKMFDLGSVLSPGVPLIRLTDISKLKLFVNVPEKEVNDLRVGQVVQIKTEVYPDLPLEGTIVSIAAKGDAAHNFETEILVSNPVDSPIRAGMYGSISITQRDPEALLLPRSALIGSAKKPQVYLIKNDTAKLVDLTLGATLGEMVTVRSGLRPGDEVVIVGQINLRDNTPIKVIND